MFFSLFLRFYVTCMRLPTCLQLVFRWLFGRAPLFHRNIARQYRWPRFPINEQGFDTTACLVKRTWIFWHYCSTMISSSHTIIYIFLANDVSAGNITRGKWLFDWIVSIHTEPSGWNLYHLLSWLTFVVHYWILEYFIVCSSWFQTTIERQVSGLQAGGVW